MKPTLTSLRSDAVQAEIFFRQEELVVRLPHVHSFPKNSCELVSAFLAVAIANKYRDSTVNVVRAYDRISDEWHFWIEIGDLILDATAHQFTEYKRPLICARPSPLEMRFPEIERLRPKAALYSLNMVPGAFKQAVITSLVRELAV